MSSIHSKTRAPSVDVPRQIIPLLYAVGRVAMEQQGTAYAVGGCVRDWCLGIANTRDVDIAVEGSAIDMARAVSELLKSTLVVHEQFGTATVTLQLSKHLTQALSVDFAMCRKEIYPKLAAYPKVSPGTLHEDLFRRDFTINAMALSLAAFSFGALIDPFHGRRDLQQRCLRVLHERSFLDDPSRVLRGIRLAQRFGLRWERRTAEWMRQAVAAGALGWLNAGRLHKELDRMYDEPDPRACFEALAALLDGASTRILADHE